MGGAHSRLEHAWGRLRPCAGLSWGRALRLKRRKRMLATIAVLCVARPAPSVRHVLLLRRGWRVATAEEAFQAGWHNPGGQGPPACAYVQNVPAKMRGSG